MKQEDIDKAFEGRWRMKRYILENIDGKAAKEIARDFFEAGLAIAEPTTVTPSSKTTIEERAEAFCNSIGTTANIAKYGMPMLREFYDYWSEPNKSNTKMRFEMQKTWDLDRRLARWARNNFYRYGNNKPTPDEQQSKLADILVG